MWEKNAILLQSDNFLQKEWGESLKYDILESIACRSRNRLRPLAVSAEPNDAVWSWKSLHGAEHRSGAAAGGPAL